MDSLTALPSADLTPDVLVVADTEDGASVEAQPKVDEAEDLFAGMIPAELGEAGPGEELDPVSESPPPSSNDGLGSGVPPSEVQIEADDSGRPGHATTLSEIATSLFTANGPPRRVDLASPPGPDRPLLLVPGIVGTFPAPGNLEDWLVTRSYQPTDLIIDPLGRVYDDLILTIQNNGYTRGTDFFVATYDWRMTPGPSPQQTLRGDGTEDFSAYDGVVEQTTADITDGKFDYGVDYLAYWLQQAVTAWQASHGGAKPDSVDVIAHSTGGLVTRVYIQSRAYDENILPKVRNFVTLGVPNRGGARAYPILHDDWNADPSYQLLGLYVDLAYQRHLAGTTITGGDGAIPAGVSRTEFISRYVPTMRALLSTYNFYGKNASATTFNRTHPTERNNLALDLNAGLDLQYDIGQLDPATWSYLGEQQADGTYQNAKPSPTRFVEKLTGKLAVIYAAVGTDNVAEPTRLRNEPWTAVKVKPRLGPTFQYWSTPDAGPTEIAFGSGPNWIARFGDLNGVAAGLTETWFSEYLRPHGGDGTVPLESGEGLYDPRREEDPAGYLVDFKTGAIGDPVGKRITTDPSRKRIDLIKLDSNGLPGQDVSHTGMVSSLEGQRQVMRALGKGLLSESQISVGHALTPTQALWMMLNPYGLAAAYNFSVVPINGVDVGITQFADEPPGRTAGVQNGARSAPIGVKSPPASPTLTAGQADALAAGVEQLGQTIEAAFAARSDLTGADLGLLERTLGSSFDLASAINATLDDLAADLLALTTPTWRQVMDVFEAADLLYLEPGYFIAPSPLEALIPVRFAYLTSGTAPVDLGENGDDLGITLTTAPSLNPDFALLVDVTIGFDFSVGLADADRFFVRTGLIQQAAMVNQETLTGAVRFDDGTEATIDSGEVGFVATLDAGFIDPDDTDGRLTTAELATIESDKRVTVIPGGELFLRLSASSLSGARYTILATGTNLVGVDPDVILIKDDTPAMRDRIADVADRLRDFGDALADSQAALNIPLPLLEPDLNTLGELLAADSTGVDLGGFFDFTATLDPYLAGPSPSLEGLIVRLQAQLGEVFASAAGDLPGGPVSLGGGFLSASRQFQLHFQYDFERFMAMDLSDEGLGVEVQGLGLDFSVPSTVSAGFQADFVLGMNLDLVLTNPLAGISTDDVFLQINTVQASAQASADNINANVTLGFLVAQIYSDALHRSHIDFSASATLPVNNGARLTLTQLTTTSPASWFTPGPTLAGSMNAEFYLSASVGSNSLATSSTPRITIADPNLFDSTPPTVTVADFGQLQDFCNITPAQALGMVRTLALSLQQFRGAPVFDVRIPFTSGTTLGDTLDFSTAFLNEIYAALVVVEIAPMGAQTDEAQDFGRLTHDAAFQLQLGTEAPVTVTVEAADTVANLSLADLLADFNGALTAAAALTGRVQAKLNEEDKLSLILSPGTAPITLKLIVPDADNNSATPNTDAMVAELGFTETQFAIERANYTGIQEFADKLEEALDPDGPGPNGFSVDIVYDAATKLITMRVAYDYELHKEVDFEFDPDLNFGPLLDVEASGSVTLDAGIHSSFTLGFDLKPTSTPFLQTTAFVPPPSNGRLTADSTFTLKLNGVGTTMTLTQASTAANASLADLAGDFNALFAAHSLGDKVTVRVSGSALVLSVINEDLDGDGRIDVHEDANNNGVLDAGEDLDLDCRLDVMIDLDGNGVIDARERSEDLDGDLVIDTQLGAINSIQIVADNADPIVTEVGFSNQEVVRSSVRGLFIENASFNVNLTATAAAEASLRFGVLDVAASITLDGALVDDLPDDPDSSADDPLDPADDNDGITLALRNPCGGTRLDLTQLLDNLSVPDRLLDLPEFTVRLNLDLPITSLTPALFGFTLPDPNLRFRMDVPDIRFPVYNPNPYDPDPSPTNSNDDGLFIDWPELGGLGAFNCLTIFHVISGLGELSGTLDDLAGFSFLNQQLPFINTSVGDLLDVAGNLADTVTALAQGDAETLTALELALEGTLGLGPDFLTLGVLNVNDPSTTIAAGAGLFRSAVFQSGGSNNALVFTSSVNGLLIDLVDDGSLGETDAAVVDGYDSTRNTVTVRYSASYTRASTIVTAVTAATGLGITLQAAIDPSDQDLTGGATAGSGTITQTALTLTLNYELGFANTLPLQLGLADLVALIDPTSSAASLLSGVTDFLQVEGSATLTVAAGAALTLKLGLDISNPCQPRVFLDDSTGITFTAEILGTELEFTAALGLLGVFVNDGTVTLDADGNPDTDGAAEFRVGFVDNNKDGRHYFREDDPLFDGSSTEIRLTAGASAALPIFFPTDTISLQGTGDSNGDGFPDNQLVIEIPDLLRVFDPIIEAEPAATGGFEARVSMPGTGNDLVLRHPSTDFSVKVFQRTGSTDALITTTSPLELRINHGVTTAAQAAALDAGGFSIDLDTSDGGMSSAFNGVAVTPVRIVTPDFASLFSSLNVCDLITNAPLLLDGLDALLGTIQEALSSSVFSHKLPLVGDKLGDAADFIADFREGLLEDLRNKLAQNGDPIALAQQAIFNALGAPGLNILVDPVTLAPLTEYSQVHITCGEGGGGGGLGDIQVDFDLRLKKTLGVVDGNAHPIDFDLGIDALGLEVEGAVQVEIGFDFQLHFVISTSEGFYFLTNEDIVFDVAGVPPAQDPRGDLLIDFTVTIPEFSAEGNLLFLEVQVSDESDGQDAKGAPREPSAFSGYFIVDLKDPIGTDGKLTVGDMKSGRDLDDFLAAQLGAAAEVNLDLEVSFGDSAAFPRLLAELDLDWEWDSDPAAEGDLEIHLNNIQIDIGTFLSRFIIPILKQIQEITGPFQPVIDILSQRLPVLSDLAGKTVTLLDLAAAFGFLSPNTAKFISALVTIADLAGDATVTSGGQVLVNAGGFEMIPNAAGELTQDAASSSAPAVDLESETAPSGDSADSEANNFLKTLEELGFSFPFLKLSELFKLFTGQPVSLVEYEPPELEFEFTYTQKFPIFPPLFAFISGTVGARADLAFGFDTLGVQEYFAAVDKNVALIFNGFYVKDVDNNGHEVVEFQLFGELGAGASIDLLAAEAGVEGGIALTVDFDLNDPNDDGKVRVNEIIANAHNDIRCVFDVHGEISAFLRAFLYVDLLILSVDKEWDFGNFTLFEFDITCPTPVLATEEGDGDLLLHMGENANLRAGTTHFEDTADAAEEFVISHVSGAPSDPDGEIVNVSWNGYTQTFAVKGSGKIIARAGQQNDTVDARGVAAPVDFEGGDGNDILYAGEGVATIEGGAGDDTIIGGPAADTLRGEEGTDTIQGEGGDDTLEGGDGNDELEGGEGGDTVQGDAGNDTLQGGAGADTLEGGEGDDTLDGGLDHDHLTGGDGDDFLDGDAGDDVLVGDLGTIVNALKVTGISGAGGDTLIGGPGADVLLGGGGDDSLFGGILFTSGVLRFSDADGSDFLEGGEGDDVLFADDATSSSTVTFPGASVSGVVWLDDDPAGDEGANSVRDEGEVLLAGVTVKLFASDGTTLKGSTVTDSEGEYAFRGLNAGDYVLQVFSPSPDLAFVIRDAADEDAMDSDVDPVSGTTEVFHLDAGEALTRTDAGLSGDEVTLSISDATVSEGDTGTTAALFVVRLSHASSDLVTVCFTTAGSSASPGSDFIAVDWALVFEPGVTSQEITVWIQGDVTHELNETFIVELCDPDGATLSDGIGLGTIVNDDLAPQISIRDGQQAEGAPENAPVEFTVTLSNPSYQTIEVMYRTAAVLDASGSLVEDAAIAGIDYNGALATDFAVLSFAPGETSQTILVSARGDALDEFDERFRVLLLGLFPGDDVDGDGLLDVGEDADGDGAIDAATASNAASIADGEGIGTIRDDDAMPNLVISGPTAPVAEGHAGVTSVRIPFALLNASGAPQASGRRVTFSYATHRGTALETATLTEPADFVAASGTITLEPGVTTGYITGEIIGDLKNEPAVAGLNEYFFVNLLSADYAGITQNHARVEIGNDDPFTDPAPWNIQFSSAHYTAYESLGKVTITLVRLAASPDPVAVYWTAAGPETDATAASAPEDYAGIWENRTSGPKKIVRFGPDQDTVTFDIAIVDDGLTEGTEVFTLHLANPTGGAVHGVLQSATVTIIDNEPAPQISIGDVTVGEAGATVSFDVVIDKAVEGDVIVNWATQEDSARGGFDFLDASGTVKIPAGDTQATVTVSLIGDTLAEDPEAFFVNLSPPALTDTVHVVVGEIIDYQAVASITDDDKATVIGFVFLDANGNGVYEPDLDSPLEGVDLAVEDAAGTQFSSTDTAGFYTGTVILGEITVSALGITLPEGLVLTTANSPQTITVTPTVRAVADIGYRLEATASVPDAPSAAGRVGVNDTVYGGPGNDELDGGGGHDYLIGGGWIGPANACEGEPYDATLIVQAAEQGGRKIVDPATLPDPGTISGTVTSGLPLNLGLAGVQVNLFDASFTLIATTYTGTRGNYSFTDLTSPVDPSPYYVQFIPPPGYAIGSTGAGGVIDVGLSARIELAAGDVRTGVNATLNRLAPGSAGPWSVQFSSVLFIARESDGAARVGLFPTAGSSEAVVVVFTNDGSVAGHVATQGDDYEEARGTFSFGAGEVEKFLHVPVIADELEEGYETVLLTLRNPTGGLAQGNPLTATLVIFDSPCADDDVIRAGEGDDLALGDFGYVNEGAPVLLGGMGNDVLWGGDGNDSLYGEGGNDHLDGGLGNDTLDGGTENDGYAFDGDILSGTDTIHEPATFGGEDTIDLSATTGSAVTLDLGSTAPQVVTAGVTLTLPVDASGAASVIENVIGGLGDDQLTGNSLNNLLVGGEGDDLLIGLEGDDTLDGGNGDDTFLWKADSALGHDTVIESDGATSVVRAVGVGGLTATYVGFAAISSPFFSPASVGGRDVFDFSASTVGVTVDLSLSSAQVVNNFLSLTISSGSVIEDLLGGSGADNLTGNALANEMDGDLGNDVLDGREGTDVLLEDRPGNWTLSPTELTLGLEVNTYSNFEEVTLIGDDSPNTLDASAFAGTVRLDGRGGADRLMGGTGTNYLTGGPGADIIDGSLGFDVFYSLPEVDDEVLVAFLTNTGFTVNGVSDTFIGSIEEAVITGGSGHDQIDASAFTGKATLEGGAGDDILRGGSAGDELVGGAGNDSLAGNGGDDSYLFAADTPLGSDTVTEEAGGGTDTLDFSGTTSFGVTVNLSLITPQTVVGNAGLVLTLASAGRIERVVGGSLADTLTGDSGANTLEGGSGDDVLSGGLGDDTLNGGSGADRVAETRDGNMDLSNTALSIGTERDALISIETATLTGGAGDNTLDATDFALGGVVLSGGGGNDTLLGSPGDDVLDGGAGDDRLSGGLGDDVYLFDLSGAVGTDTVTEAAGGGTDALDYSALTNSARGLTVRLNQSTAQTVAVAGANVLQRLILSGADVVEKLIGGAGDDLLVGNTLANTLEGRGGNDTLRGGEGDDVLIGNQGDDTYKFDADNSLGHDQIIEALEGGGMDVLDFTETSASVSVDLGEGAEQEMAGGNLFLWLRPCHAVEIALGASTAALLPSITRPRWPVFPARDEFHWGLGPLLSGAIEGHDLVPAPVSLLGDLL